MKSGERLLTRSDILSKQNILCFIGAIFFVVPLYANGSEVPPGWAHQFFTDDSSYYLKLLPDGFVQRFRLHKKYCDQLDYATIHFQEKDHNYQTHFSKMNRSEQTRWGVLYGIDENDYCWYKVSATGLDLNRPNANRYVINLRFRQDGKNYYFHNHPTSILPSQRFTTDESQINWIDLGRYGATPLEAGGTFFKIWEPDAEKVILTINQDTHNNQYVMHVDKGYKHPELNHVMFLGHVKADDDYSIQFVKNGQLETINMINLNQQTAFKFDPYGKAVRYDIKGGKINGYWNIRAVVTPSSKYEWKFDHKIGEIPERQKNNWLIYQLWPLTFNPQKENGKYVQGTFLDIVEKLDYISGLGVTAVELLPHYETRFNASWGYAMDSLVLVEKTLGTPDDLRYLVDQMHSRGMKVVFDMVLNHINNNLIRDLLNEHIHESKFYSGNTVWGPKPRFANRIVKKWIADAVISVIRDYHIDGLRFDMIAAIYNQGNGGYEFLQELNSLIKIVHPTLFTMAEELPDNVWATKTVPEGGMGFDSQWNDKFKNFFELEFDDYNPYHRHVKLEPLKASLEGYSDHFSHGNELHFGVPQKTVNYLGSHDFIGNKNPFIRIISDYEGYEWDGKNNFYRVRPLEDPDLKGQFRKVHNPFTHGMTRLAYGILFSKPGPLLFYQGEELGQDLNIENEWSYLDAIKNNAFPSKNIDLHRYISSHRMTWEYLHPENEPTLNFLTPKEHNLFHGTYRFFKRMIQFRRDYPFINEKNASHVHIYYDQNLLTYRIQSEEKRFFVVANFGPSKEAAWVNFPAGNHTWWKEVVNTSETRWGGNSDRFQNIISNLGGRQNLVRVDEGSLLIFEEQKIAEINSPLYLRGDITDWKALPHMKLLKSSDKGDIYSVQFDVHSRGEFAFKLGTKDWEVDIGLSHHHQPEHSRGVLSYRPFQPNFIISFKPGTYKFIFNINTFKYVVLKL